MEITRRNVRKNVQNKRWREQNREKWLASHNKSNTKMRLQALRVVVAGGVNKVTGTEILKCENCGCDDVSLLQINHLNGGGYKEAKKTWGKGYTSNLWQRILHHGRDVSDLNLLCGPCNTLSYLKRMYPNKERFPTVTWQE